MVLCKHVLTTNEYVKSLNEIENVKHDSKILTDSIHFTTHDHKPNDPLEENRIIKSGRHVTAGRISASLAVARDEFILKLFCACLKHWN